MWEEGRVWWRTHLIITTMRTTQLLRQHHAGNERENGRKDIHHEQHGRDRQTLYKYSRDSEEPDDPAEGGREHGVVYGGVGAGFAGQDVANQGRDEEDPEELETSD